MKYILLVLLIATSSQFLSAQTNKENRNLVYDAIGLKIIQSSDSILSDPSKWNNHPDTNFMAIKKVLKEAIDEFKKQLE